MKIKSVISLVLALVLALGCLAFTGCEKEEAGDGAHVKVKMTVKDFGDVVMELYPEYAPITVENFVSLVESGFYDGLTFHRVYSGFMIQGGDPANSGRTDTAKTIKGEFRQNGVNNPLSHERGVVSMARTTVPDSASSQFFICHGDATFLDGQYAGFGKVIEGMEVVDEIAKIECVSNGFDTVPTAPVNPPVIESMTVID